MIGPLEILILILVGLLVFGGYKKLPQLGRSAGEGARKLGESAMAKGGEAKELAASVNEKHGDKLDPATLARKAGKGAREARELRDSFTGADSPKPPESSKAAAADESRSADSST